MVRVEGFEPPTAWFVARNSIQLSYTRTFLQNYEMAVREGFEPSIELQTLYSLSRGAPSAARPPHRFVGRILKKSATKSTTFIKKNTFFYRSLKT